MAHRLYTFKFYHSDRELYCDECPLVCVSESADEMKCIVTCDSVFKTNYRPDNCPLDEGRYE